MMKKAATAQKTQRRFCRVIMQRQLLQAARGGHLLDVVMHLIEEGVNISYIDTQCDQFSRNPGTRLSYWVEVKEAIWARVSPSQPAPHRRQKTVPA